MKKIFLFLLYLVTSTPSFSQEQNKIDSLENELKKFEASKKNLGKVPALYDTTKANILNAICEEYWMNGPEKGIDCSMKLLQLSEQIGFSKGIANAYNSLGVTYFYQGNYSQALESHKKALKISEEAGNKKGIAFSILCIGNVYRLQGNPEALKNYFTALKLFDELGDKKYIASCYNNIGIIYDNQHNYAEALKYYLSTLKIMQGIGYKLGIAVAYGNIGVVYQEEGNYQEALKNYFACLSISRETGNKASVALSLGNIGSVYHDQGNYPEALKNEFASLKISEEIGDKGGIARIYLNIGSTYLKLKETGEASVFLNKGLSLGKEIGDQESIRDGYRSLATLDSTQGDFRQSLEYYKLFMAYNDSMMNNETTKKITQQQMQYEFDKKQVADSLKFAQEKEIGEIKLQKQKAYTYGGLAGIAVTIILLFFAYSNYKKQRIANQKLKAAQEQLIKSEKMAAFGIMASRVSHEIQNPLNFVNNFSELSKEMVEDIMQSMSEDERKQNALLLVANLEKINEHGKRAESIVRQLQEHTNKGTAHEFFEEN